MKFILTESQFLKLLSKFLEQREFEVVENDNYIYFLNQKSKNKLNIVYGKDTNYCFVTNDLVNKIKIFFSLDVEMILDLIAKWINIKYNLKIKNTTVIFPWEEHIFS